MAESPVATGMMIPSPGEKQAASKEAIITHPPLSKILPIFFLAARSSERDERDARIIKASVASALEIISKQYQSVEAMLLASGPGRVFPPFVALVEMIRGITSAFNGGVLDPKFRKFSINVIDPGVIQLIRAGKLNLQELLLVGLFRIGVEVWRSESEVLRLSELISENTEISEIRTRYYIPETGWLFMVEPSPTGSKDFQLNADENGTGSDDKLALGFIPRCYFAVLSGAPSVDDGTLNIRRSG